MQRRDFLKSTAVGGTVLALSGSLSACNLTDARTAERENPFVFDWEFQLADSPTENAWESVTLPHTARIESLVTGPPGSETYQWQGLCWYRKNFDVTIEMEGKHIEVRFGAAMNVADVWLNDTYLGQHLGGFLPFAFDISDLVQPGANELRVRLDNTDNALTGPKPLKDLDFNMYGGLYRDVHLRVTDRLHITDPILADQVAGGGVFVRTENVTAEHARIIARVHMHNTHPTEKECHLQVALKKRGGDQLAWQETDPVLLSAGADHTFEVIFELDAPHLWSLTDPHLHTVHTYVRSNGTVVDAHATRFGIRDIRMSKDGFWLNGERTFLRGTNRHQEYPYIGYAVPDDAQWRDAKRIKDAGFDYIRLSHYPQDDAFMDACDELGLVVMACIPGWQYFDRESAEFAEMQLANCRALMRKERNHPCVILWEVSLNESWMTDDFIARSHALAHEEYPGDQCYTCGWSYGYDVFIQARQHGGCRDVTDRPCLVSEYGDWEYYAQNAGLNQGAWADLAPDDANSRQLRWHGEKGLLQQATNFQEAHNDNRKTIAFADGLWVMFDYNRGYAPDIESSGCMDIFRLPKFSRDFFASQRPAAESAPMTRIASHWTPESATNVRVFSNCEEVELQLNGATIARQTPDEDRLSTHLNHPPFTFSPEAFEPGTLTAIGFIGEQEAARHEVRTPGPAHTLRLEINDQQKPFAANGRDVVFAHARVTDDNGTTTPDAWVNVSFAALGPVTLIGTDPFSSEAGIASIVVRADAPLDRATLYALAISPAEGGFLILDDKTALAGSATPCEIRYTTDGSEPTATSSIHQQGNLIPETTRIRAALFADGQLLAHADSDSERFRIAGSTAPDVMESH